MGTGRPRHHPYTLEGRITTEPAVTRYEGDLVGTRHVFDVKLVVTGLDDQPRAGFVTYTFVPDSRPSGDGIGVSQGVAARVRIGAWPADLATIPAEIAVSDLRLARHPAAGTGLLDRLLPNLPRVISRGPGIMSARTTNVGDVLVRVDATLTLERVPWTAALPFTQPRGTVMVRSVDRARLLVPRERWTTRAPTTVTLGSGEEVDRLPFLGFVRVTVESSARMGATTSDASTSAVYLVAPWEEALLAAAAYALYRWARRRWRSEPRPDEPDDAMTDSSEELMVGESPSS